MAETLDPLTQVYQALWAMLDDDPQLAAWFPARRRLDPDPRDARVEPVPPLPADLPQLRITPGLGLVQLFRTSHGTVVTQRFDLELKTASLAPAHQLFPVKWRLIRAFAAARDHLGLDFVRRVRPVDISHKPRPTSRETGAPGYTTLLRIDVEMWFDAEQLAN